MKLQIEHYFMLVILTGLATAAILIVIGAPRLGFWVGVAAFAIAWIPMLGVVALNVFEKMRGSKK
jgi:hypothetical protein